MKSAKRWFAVIFTLALLLACVSPLLAANASDGHKNDPYRDYVRYEHRGNVTAVIPRDEDGPLNVIFPDEANPDLDWDGILAQLRTLIYTDVSEINISAYGMKYPDDYAYLHNQIYYNPVFLRTPVRITYYPSTGIVAKLYIENENYLDGAENLRKYNACLDAIEQIMYGVREDGTLSLADKCLLLHDRLAAWCEYDYANFLAKYSTHTGDIPDSSYSPYGPLVLRTGVCNGIALAYNWMMDILGVENYYIASDTLNHGWSMVYLDGEPYYLDVTHDDPVWDVTGRVQHRYFLVSFNTYSAGHDNVTDIPDTPVSTLYEDYFCKNTNTEVVYIDGDLYYLNADNGNIVRRTPAGEETVVKTVDVRFYYAKDGSNWSTLFYPKMTSIGDEIVYLAPREVHAYNPLTDEDRVVFIPSDNIFPETDYRLTGLQQVDGVVYVTANNTTNFSENTKADYTESFPFCPHENTVTLARTFGATCLDGGSAKILCADCRKLTYSQETSFGPHDFSAQNAVPEALASAGTCIAPAAYYYSCALCGAVEENDAHTFTNGVFGSHSYTAAVVKDEALKTEANCQSAAEYYYSCAECGAVENNDAHTFTSGGVAEHQWAWVVDTEPTCGDPGVEHQECTVCHAKQHENDMIEPTGDHDWEWVVDTPATCGFAGLQHQKCTVCGNSRNFGTRIQPTGQHTFDTQDARPEARKSAATCTSPAVYYYICGACSTVEYNDAHTYTAGDPLPHNFTAQNVKAEALKSAATCRSAAEYYYSCAECGTVEKDDARTFTAGSKADHSWEWQTDLAATCGAAGVKHEECSVCQVKRSENTVIPATGNHSWNGGVVTEPATCTSEGVKTFTCTVCGTTRPQRIDKTDHIDGNGDGVCDTCGSDLTADRCKYCGQVHTGVLGGVIKVIHEIFWFFRNLFK